MASLPVANVVHEALEISVVNADSHVEEGSAGERGFPDLEISVVNEDSHVEEGSAGDTPKGHQLVQTAVLRANDGLLAIASLQIGAGAVNDDRKSLFLAATVGLVGGTCSTAIGDFMSTFTQSNNSEVNGDMKHKLQAAIISGLAFSVGGVIPLVTIALTRANHTLMLGIVGSLACLAQAYKSATTRRM